MHPLHHALNLFFWARGKQPQAPGQTKVFLQKQTFRIINSGWEIIIKVKWTPLHIVAAPGVTGGSGWLVCFAFPFWSFLGLLHYWVSPPKFASLCSKCAKDSLKVPHSLTDMQEQQAEMGRASAPMNPKVRLIVGKYLNG